MTAHNRIVPRPVLIAATLCACVFAGCSGQSSDSTATSSSAAGLPEAKGDPGDPVYEVGGDPKMQAAIAQAKQTLPEFVAAVRRRDPEHVYFAVKKPFATPDGGFEHIWISEVSLVGNGFRGYLDNTPAEDVGARQGDTITVQPDEISDWMIVTSDQRLIGGYTIRALRDIMTPDERKAFDAQMGLILD